MMDESERIPSPPHAVCDLAKYLEQNGIIVSADPSLHDFTTQKDDDGKTFVRVTNRTQEERDAGATSQ